MARVLVISAWMLSEFQNRCNLKKYATHELHYKVYYFTYTFRFGFNDEGC